MEKAWGVSSRRLGSDWPEMKRPRHEGKTDQSGGGHRMLVYVEIWHRQTADADYRRHGIEELEGLLEPGAPMTFEVDGADRRVTVDRASPTAISIAAVGTL